MSNSDERTRYRFECECNGEIPMEEEPGVKWFSSPNLGDVLRQAFVVHKAAYVKRCIRYTGVWYVKA